MPSIITNFNETVANFPIATISTKQNLQDADEEWGLVPFLYLDKLTLSCNAYDQAEMTLELGEVIQPGATNPIFELFEALDLAGDYVRIIIPQFGERPDFEWIGYVIGTANERSAVKQGFAPEDDVITGRKQSIRAVGLEWFLDRVQITKSIVDDGDGDVVHIARGITFNGGKGIGYDGDSRVRPNRSDDRINDAYAFMSSSLEEGRHWRIVDIVEYLLKYFQPERIVGVPAITTAPAPSTFVLDEDDVNDSVLSGVSPTLNVENMTVFQVLNRLVAPQRGFVWWATSVEVAPGEVVTTIDVETLSATEITLPTLGTIPANRDQQTLDFDHERDVEDVVTASAGRRQYHQVICRGARMTSTCSLEPSYDDIEAQLNRDWTDEDEFEYNEAAGGAGVSNPTPYVGLSDLEKKTRNDAFRESERLARVYSYFRLRADWNGRAYNDEIAFPTLSLNGSVTGTMPFSVNGLRMLNYTRLKRGWKYEDVGNIVNTTPPGTEPEWQPTFGVIAVANLATPTAEGYEALWQFTEKLSTSNKMASTGVTLVSPKITVNFNLRMQHLVPGIILEGTPQHACAKADFPPAVYLTNVEPQVDWRALAVTTTLEADTYCEGRFPEDDVLPPDVPIQRLVLYLGEEYRLDFLPEGTIVDLHNGLPVKTNETHLLRDDRAALADIARTCYEWHRAGRLPITVTFKQLRNLFRLGMLITQIGEGSNLMLVNTVITQITYDCVRGRTIIQTNDEDFDVIRVA